MATAIFLTPDADGPLVEIARRSVVFQRSWVPGGGDRPLYQGGDERVMREWTRAAEIAKTIIADVLAHPEWMAARSFSELHDHCDANVLGDQEAYLVECGWTGTDDAKDEAARNAAHLALEGAQTIVGLWLATKTPPSGFRVTR